MVEAVDVKRNRFAVAIVHHLMEVGPRRQHARNISRSPPGLAIHHRDCLADRIVSDLSDRAAEHAETTGTMMIVNRSSRPDVPHHRPDTHPVIAKQQIAREPGLFAFEGKTAEEARTRQQPLQNQARRNEVVRCCAFAGSTQVVKQIGRDQLPA